MLIEPVDGDEAGKDVEVSLENAGSENSSVTIPMLSEKPLFLFIEFDQSVSIKADDMLVQDFQLRIIPNPFNSEIKIEYELSAASDVHLSIYDVNGRLIERRKTGRQKAGLHQQHVNFAVYGLATGVYIVQVRAGLQIWSEKVCYTK